MDDFGSAMRHQYTIPNAFIRYAGWLAASFFIGVLALVFVRGVVIEPGRVDGRSMEDTFLDDDLFFVDKLTPLFIPPRRGDIVQFYELGSNKLIIKRIIGIPGDQIVISKNAVFVTGPDGVQHKLDEPYLKPNTVTRTPRGTTVEYPVIPKASYFVLGDNRPQSNDSREIGFVHRSYITGRVILLPFLNNR